MRTLHLVKSSLVERTAELAALRGAVRAGRGVVVLEAPAGLGKTALLDDAAATAEEAGWLVRRATPGPLEHHFPFGVIRALLETPVRESGLPLDGAAAAAGELLTDAYAPAGDTSMMLMAHSVLWVCQGLSERRPLALVIDDAHFADRMSLAVLSYLARRVQDLPLLILIAARGSDEMLSVIGGTRMATVLRPRPLSVRGALELFGDDPVARTHHRETGGNPWLLRALAANGGELSEDACAVVRRRLAELPPRDRGVAEALAVLGACTAPHVVAAVAGVPAAEVLPARDALVSAGLLASGGERFAHRLITQAIVADIVLAERERLHRETARVLMDGDSSSVAGHLLECSPQGDPEVSEFLVGAARTAPPPVASRYLERALEERAQGDDRAAILAQLATVAFAAGLPDARRRLRAALPGCEGPAREEVLTRLAALTFFEGGELREAVDPVAALDTLMDDPGERARRVTLLALSTHDPLEARVVLAHRAFVAVEQGKPAAASLALRALEDGALLGIAHQRGAYVLAVRALVLCDHPAAGGAIDALREHESLALRVAAAWLAGEHALRGGRVADAELEARLALSLALDRFAPLAAGARAVLASALSERGAFAEAEELGAARARVWLAMGDYERAYAAASTAGRVGQAGLTPGGLGDGALAALALAHLGRRGEAAALADAELERARHSATPGRLAGAYLARAVAEADPVTRAALCETGLAVGAHGLETVRLRLELGSALAYMGRRVEAREALRPALAEADAAGAVLLSQRARRELVATGLRPRQAAIEGTAALTPRQRQICELAAIGKGNRAIAQELFLSIKTVETHLAAGFRKLGVSNRAELAAELAA